MSTTDLVSDVLDYLVAQCQAAAVPGGTLAGVMVLDGPQPTQSVQGVEQVLWIGEDPKNPGTEIGQAEQDFALVDHGRTRDETGWVTCAAKHWTGDPAMAVHREGCKAIVAGLELLLRGDPASGGPGDASLGGLVFWAQLTGATWYQDLVSGGGAEAVCVFRVGYFGRLVTS